jgi:nucleotide-binding universal stress UspA family protein
MAPEPGYERILVPVDGSETAMVALAEAIDLADRLGATIHGLYVVDPRHYHGFTTEDIVLDALEREGDAALADLRERCRAREVPVETTTERGHPSAVICDFADENEMDRIVMATHGRRGLDRFLLGSVTERVVRRANVPVLTVRAPADA